MHQQQLAMLAQHQSLLMAAVSKSTGINLRYPTGIRQPSSNVSVQIDHHLVSRKQNLTLQKHLAEQQKKLFGICVEEVSNQLQGCQLKPVVDGSDAQEYGKLPASSGHDKQAVTWYIDSLKQKVIMQETMCATKN